MEKSLQQKHDKLSKQITKELDSIYGFLEKNIDDEGEQNESFQHRRFRMDYRHFKSRVMVEFKKQLVLGEEIDEILEYMSFVHNSLKEIQFFVQENHFDIVMKEFSQLLRQADVFVMREDHRARRMPIGKIKADFRKVEEEIELAQEQLSDLAKKGRRLNTLVQKFEDKDSDLQEKVNQASKTVDKLTDAKQYDFYAESALEHRNVANKYRGLTNGWLIISIASILNLMMSQPEVILNIDGFSSFLLRFSVLLIIFAPAVYFSRESNKHRQVEFRHEKLKLELGTFSPYVSELNDDLKDEVRLAFAYRLFGEEMKKDDKDFYSKMKVFKNNLGKAEKELEHKKKNVESLNDEIQENISKLQKIKLERSKLGDFDDDDIPF